MRIDPQLWAWLQAWAADEFRSVNSQIEFILKNAVAAHRHKKMPGEDNTAAPGEKDEELPEINNENSRNN